MQLSKVFLAVVSALCATNAVATNINNNQESTIDYLWSDTSSTNVGYETNGILNIIRGGEVQTDLLKIGRAGSNGIVNVVDGGKLTIRASSYSYPLDIGGTTDVSSTQSKGDWYAQCFW